MMKAIITWVSLLNLSSASLVRESVLRYGGPYDASGAPLMDLSIGYDHVIVIPESYGDFENLIGSIKESFKGLSGGTTFEPSFFDRCAQCLIGKGDLSCSHMSVPGERVLMIQMGNNSLLSGTEAESVLHRVKFCMGWTVRVLLSASDLTEVQTVGDENAPPVHVHAFRNYGMYVRAARSLFVSSGIDLGWMGRHMHKIVQMHMWMRENGNIGKLLDTKSPLNSGNLSILMNDFDLCGSILPRILLQFDVDRIFVSQQSLVPHSVSTRCDGRLVYVDVEMGRNHPYRRTRDGGALAVVINSSGTTEFTAGRFVAVPEPTLPVFESRDFPDYEHVIVISDLHGDYEYAISSLCLGLQGVFGEVDCQVLYKGINAALVGFAHGSFDLSHLPILTEFSAEQKLNVLIVQMGDVVDRGPDSKKIYLLFDHLEHILGIKTVSLIGNHELIQHLNDQDARGYVSDEERDLYGGEAARAAEFTNGFTWDRIFSKYSAAIKVGENLFVHGGIDKGWFEQHGLGGFGAGDAPIQVDELNAWVKYTLLNPRKTDDDLMNPKSPFWTRFLAEGPEQWSAPPEGWAGPNGLPVGENLCDEYLDPILTAFRVTRIIVGHTPQSAGIVRSRCAGKIVLSDVAISRWMRNTRQGQPMALVIHQGAISARYAPDMVEPTAVQDVVPNAADWPNYVTRWARVRGLSNLLINWEPPARPAPGAPRKRHLDGDERTEQRTGHGSLELMRLSQTV